MKTNMLLKQSTLFKLVISRSISSCPEGTILKGINVMKNGQDPIAMADDKYPPWLWTILEPKQTEFTDIEKLSLKYMRKQSKAKILNYHLTKGR